MADVYKIIYQTTRAMKPDSVTQSACGTTPNLAWLGSVDQAVTADPVGAVQGASPHQVVQGLLWPEAAV